MDTGKKKSKATITAVHNEEGGDESGDDAEVEGNATPSASTSSTSGSGSGDAERELQDSAVPRSKPSGKKQSERSEFQSKLLDFLERDLEKDDKESQQPDDPIDLQVMSMAQRIKKELPQSEQFNILLKLQQLLNDSIMQVNRRQFINKVPMEEGQSFFQDGREVQHVQQAVVNVPRQMPELQRGPMVQREVQVVQVDNQDFIERTLEFEEM